MTTLSKIKSPTFTRGGGLAASSLDMYLPVMIEAVDFIMQKSRHHCRGLLRSLERFHSNSQMHCIDRNERLGKTVMAYGV